MKITDVYLSLGASLIKFIELQLFLSLVSLPFLIGWGIPFSIMSAVGNLVFGPVLTLFLLISSAIFFTELIYVPNDFLITMLDTVTRGWLWTLSWHQRWWLIGFTKPPLFFLCLIPLCALYILSQYKNSQLKKIGLFFGLLTCIYVGLSLHGRRSTGLFTIPLSNGKNLTLIVHKGITIVIDPGVLGSLQSPVSYIQYTLLPTIIQKTGTCCIDTLCCLQPSGRSFKAIEILCSKINVKTVYIPLWEGSIHQQAWHHFFCMKNYLEQEQITLKRLNYSEIDLAQDNDFTCTVAPIKHKLKYLQANFLAYLVSGFVDGHAFSVYSAKYPNSSV